MDLQHLREQISQYYCVDEGAYIETLKASLCRSESARRGISAQANEICQFVRTHSRQTDSLQDLLHEFQLSSDEGIALMVLSEALLRIPDRAVAVQLIADRIQPVNWQCHFDTHKSHLINASTLLLMLGGKLLISSEQKSQEGYAHQLLRKVSQPLIHKAVAGVIEKLADQFVFAESEQKAMQEISSWEQQRDYFSLDMLGEAAICELDAERYTKAYRDVIEEIQSADLQARSSISIKLSALHPRYEYRHRQSAMEGITKRLRPLIKLAISRGLDITLDAEEADRLELGLDIFTLIYRELSEFKINGGDDTGSLGIAVQAYGTRALAVLKYLRGLAEQGGVKIPVRLVKGAYWDTEIKQAQASGLAAYPVFTSKHHTDISYLACSEYLLTHRDSFYPQFATHNIVSICDILRQAKPDESYEFQRLHGMGELIYEVVRKIHPDLKVRIYGPVGEHKLLLPYLVRRILENGSNSGFVKQLLDEQDELTALCKHPLDQEGGCQMQLPLPSDIYLPSRENSRAVNLADSVSRDTFMQGLAEQKERFWQSDWVLNESEQMLAMQEVLSPFDEHAVGECHQLSADQALECLAIAEAAFKHWRQIDVVSRQEMLKRYAVLLESKRYELVSLLIREAGKTVSDALGEVREAIDFAYYYARSMGELSKHELPNIVGETNELQLRGRGVFLCISPWNFPLAIFSGQVCAALVSGNTVLAKPAELTPLIARYAVELMHQAGVAKDVVQLLPGKGSEICTSLCLDRRLAGVAFTGSTATAKQINRVLSEREAAIIPFIAETGGQNVMIVDSSALPEQLVKDVIQSAFYSAGQRCSALRVLYLQEEVADSILTLLQGALETLEIGDPAALSTDIGPVISEQARQELMQHCHALETKGQLLFKYSGSAQSKVSPRHVVPHVFEITSINDLNREHFGPLLHVIRYRYQDIDQIVNEINQYGFGLTCGIQSRNLRWSRQLAAKLDIGNIYLNRDMVGAVVGAQPFGGQGNSGTGFKAGGPHYLLRYMTETTLTSNLSAIGGSVELVAPHK